MPRFLQWLFIKSGELSLGNYCFRGILRHRHVAKLSEEAQSDQVPSEDLSKKQKYTRPTKASFPIVDSFCSTYDPPILNALSFYNALMTACIIDYCIIEGVWN